jgi:hypothetical protein
MAKHGLHRVIQWRLHLYLKRGLACVCNNCTTLCPPRFFRARKLTMRTILDISGGSYSQGIPEGTDTRRKEILAALWYDEVEWKL